MKAFPDGTKIGDGMDLRDYFASQIIAGLSGHPDGIENETRAAKWAYYMADVMMEVREQK